VDDLSTNVKRGIRTKIEKGGWPTKAPFGYLNDKANKIIYPDPVRAPLIVEMFNLYVTGNYSIKDLVNIMYDKGLRTLGGYKVHKSVLHRTLTNPVHCGFVVQNGKYFAGTHTPIVGQELFDNVQSIINGKNKSRKQTHNFLHRGFMNCHVCGCALTATNKKGHDYYYCTNGKGNCEQHKKYLRSESVDNIMSKIFSDIEFEEEVIEIMYLAKKEELGNDKTYTETAIQNITKQLTLAREKQSKLVDSYLASNISEDLYNAKIQALNNEVTATENQLKKLLMKNKEIPRKKSFRIFLKEFNTEAKKQKSEWFAEVQNKEDKREEYHFLQISKYVGWWIFKEKISLHISESSGYFSFVNNDFSFSEYGEKQNEELFALFPEFKNIIQNCNFNFFILRDYHKSDFQKRFNELNNRLETIEMGLD